MWQKHVKVEDLKEIFEAESRGLYNYLLALARNPDDAQDLLQTVFVKFMQQVTKGTIARDKAGNYMVRMARNEWINLARKRGRETPVDGAALDLLPAKAPRPEREGTVKVANRILADAIANPEIPEIVREVLRLRFWENTKIADICALLKKPRSSVYATLKVGVGLLVERFLQAGITVEVLDE